MKKNMIKTDTFREIRKTLNRFISILVIVAMGVGFFVGVKATAPSMMNTAEQYFEDTKLMDLEILSTFGFGDEDIEKLEQVEGVTGVMASYSADLLVENSESDSSVVKVISIYDENSGFDEMNVPEVIEGRMPESAEECLVESSKFISSYEVGDKITFAEMTGETNVDEVLSNRQFTVVGKIKSSSYISYDRGTTYVGNGTIDSVVMIPKENFLYTRYTEVYVTCDTGDASCFDDEYSSQLDVVSKNIQSLGEEQYDVFKSDTMSQLTEAETDFNTQKEEAQKQLADAKAQLDTARSQIQDALAQLESGRKELAENEKLSAEQLADGENQINSAKASLKDAYNQIQTGQQEYNAGKANYESQIASATQQISDGWAQYNAGVEQLNQSAQQLFDGQNQLNDGWAQYNEGAQQIADGQQQLEQSRTQIETLQSSITSVQQYTASIQDAINQMRESGASEEQIAQYQQALDQANQQIAELQAQVDSGNEQIAAGEAQLAEAQAQLDASKAQLDASQAELDAGQAQLEAGRQELENSRAQLESAQAQLESESAAGKAELDAAAAQLESGKQEYEDGMKQVVQAQEELVAAKANAEQQLESGRQEIASGEQEIAEGQKELDENQKKYDEAVAEAEKQINDGSNRIQNAKQTLGGIDAGVWYVFDRDNNPGYSGFSQDAARVDAMAGVFPVFFLLVAILVCLTTMTRMVEEERGQIGTLKALGYSSKTIASKYFIYSFTASLIGGVIGMFLGALFLPKAIMSAYSAMYDIPALNIVMPWVSGIIALIVALICTTAVAMFTCYKELREKPAQLMRPKAPKEGKRILLERMSFIWRKMSFSHKVTARNLFRYKGRLIMTIIGIAGCTALITAGLGLQDSISVIVPKQFENINNYDTIISLRTTGNANELSDVSDTIKQTDSFDNYMYTMQYIVNVPTGTGDSDMDVYLFVPESTEKLSEFLNLHERKHDDENQQLDDNGVIITEKVATTLNLSVGDQISFLYSDVPYSAVVEGIAENYVYHYIYMSPALYKQIMGEEVKFNSVLAQTNTSQNKEKISEKLLVNQKLTSVIYTDSIISDFKDTIKSLNTVVYIMVFAAGALAFVVLYNLTNINISERIREVATIKVLGFYDHEVNMYVFRENIVMTIMGIIVGLVLGFFISKFMVLTIEMDMVMFGRNIDASSFIIASILTLIFTLCVNQLMSIKMKKISMVESLKSVE